MRLNSIISILNNLIYHFDRNLSIKNSKLIFSRIKVNNHNISKIENSIISNSKVHINSGVNNTIKVYGSEVSDSLISIDGNHNTLEILDNVKLRKANIVIRGQNCIVSIGKGTTFGSVRIINVGKKNNITIGENCLFADNIEIWASDTHSIYDKYGNFINPESSINIGNHVWICSHAKILKGVFIGEGSIVGMNSLVTKNVNANTLNVGIPSRSIKNDISWSLKYINEEI